MRPAQATATATKPLEPLPDRLKLKTFILKHWTSSFIHSAGHLPACYHTRKGIHAKYCNGVFLHYKTKEGILHGEFKQTFVVTIEAMLAIIKELAAKMGEAPPPKAIPDFEESSMYPKGYPKPLPELQEPAICSCTYPMTCRKHIKKLPTRDADEFFPHLMDEKLLVLEPMPPEPAYQKIPEYQLPLDLKKTPEFEYDRVIAEADLCEDGLIRVSVDEPPLEDRRLVAGIVSITNVGEGNWRFFGECLNALAKHCQVIVVISPDGESEEHDKALDYIENGEGGGVNKPKLEQCRIETAVRKFKGNRERATELDLLRSDIIQARELTGMEVGRSKEKRRIVASHCICARVDMTDQADPKKLVSVVAAAQMLEHKKKQLEEAGPSFRPNQILVFPLKLSSDFTPPAPQIYPPFDESPFEMPPRPSVRPTMELPRISSYLPFAFRPFDDNLPQTIYDLPTGTGQLCRIKPPVWQDPILDDDEKVIVPDFEWTDMRLKRQTTPCLSLVPFYKGVELELEPVKQFQTDERHRVYHLPQYIAPELLTFVPMETPEISFENARWLPNRQIKSIDRFLLQQDLGQNPVFVLDAAGSMSGDRWQSLLSNMLDLFSEDGLVRYFTSSFDILVTQNSNVYSFSGGAGPRRQLTSSSDFSCECARSWLLQWVPGGNADMMAAIISALECQPSEIHIITDKHPERSQPILELIRKRCRDGGSSDDDRPRVNCVAFEAHRPACRFLHRMAQMTGGSYREFKLHVAACPLMRQSASVLGMRISGDTKNVDDVEDKELGMAKIFWNKVKDALLRNGIIAWMLDTDKSSNGILPTRDVVRNVKSLLEKAGMSSGEMAEMFLTEDDFGEDEDIDIRDLVRAVVIDGYTKTPHDKPQPPVRFFGLSPKTREVIIQNSDVLLQFFRQVDDDGGEEALCLLPRDVVKALDAFNAEHKLGISEVELVKCSFLVMPSDDGRIDCNELLSFFDKDAAKRAARVQQQSELRKKMSHNKEECECVKSTTYSDDSLIHFLTPEEQHERMEHIRREENEYLAKKQRIEAEIREKNDRQRLEVEAANEASLREAQQDHERRLKEFHDNLDEQVRKDRDAFFERHAAKPTARNTSRVLKNAYDILRLNVSEGNRPGGVPPWTVEELLHIFADPLSLIDERVKREALEERTKAHADALEKMGGTRTVPNILEFNTKTLHATLSNGEGMGRTGLLHDVRDCPICSLAVPLSAETNIEDQEWHMVDVKLMFPHFNDEMMVPEIAYSVQKALARVFIQGDFFVQTTDVELYKLTNTKPGPVEAYNGMKFKLQVQCLIFMHSGLDKCRHAVQRFDTFLKAGELGKTLEHAGFPMKLLRKGKVEFDKPKVSHRPVNQERVESVKVSLDQYEAEWNEYVRALEVEDARQKEADEERLAMHKRLCTAAERENYRRLAVKKRRLQKEHKILLRSINDQNQARLKKYQALLKKENKVLNDEERAKHAAKQAAAEKLFNHDFDQVAENNKMAKHEWEQLKEYNANYHKEKSRLAMAKRDAYKVWQAENKAVKFGNDAMLKVCVFACVRVRASVYKSMCCREAFFVFDTQRVIDGQMVKHFFSTGCAR